MEKDYVSNLIIGDKYYSVTDLRYNQKVGLMLSKEQFCQFLDIKDQLAEEGAARTIKLPLRAFNSKHIFSVNGLYLLQTLNEYLRILSSDYDLNQSLIFDRNIKNIMESRLFSEIEGTLNIENIPTTHKRITEIKGKENLTDKNDIIVKNMLDALEFIINEKPAFNRENLLKLYNILSNRNTNHNFCCYFIS